VDVEPTPAFPGKLGRIGVFDLGQGAVSSDPRSRAISVANAPLTLQASTAQSCNEAFAEGRAVFGAVGQQGGLFDHSLLAHKNHVRILTNAN
jgi:hypothetical protein